MLLAHTFVQKIRIMANKVTDMSKIRKVNKLPRGRAHEVLE